ncbi:glyceraldehyde-3-phosphate dehydrogenase [bacterium]|nr:glyceraldehyde-3-phosphate dehydrogenase [candidate division CSSED10-310 bacterium]
MSVESGKKVLGINGAGRIGKLTLWHHLHRGYFDTIVINLGRAVGSGLDDVVQSIVTDSTYGPIQKFLYGLSGTLDVSIVDADHGLLTMFGKQVKILQEARNPRDIAWRREGVQLVVDTTGVFTDPTVPADDAKGSIRGHLEAGAKVVINSAPFKIKDKSRPEPDDTTMMIYGINHTEYRPGRHRVISAASCTTTGLAHMIKPLLETEETSRILTASMSTIHAATNTQSVLDTVAKTKATDLRKNRSILNNIILSTTGAAKALEKVLPEIKRVGFMADSVRIPTSTVSVVNLNMTFHTPVDAMGEPVINRAFINGIYERAAHGSQKGQLLFSVKQNVSADLIGVRAAVVIEGNDTHTRTGFVEIPPEIMASQGITMTKPISFPVTHAKIFGWYDNEYGSYTCALGDLTEYIDRMIA